VLHNKLEQITGDFVSETSDLRKKLRNSTVQVVTLKTVRDDLKDKAAVLHDARGSNEFKYKGVIMGNL
jgi:hypothetical protein